MTKLLGEVPALLKYWSPINVHRNNFKKLKVTSTILAFWYCEKCDFLWKASIKTTYKNSLKSPTFCPRCDFGKYLEKGVNDIYTKYPNFEQFINFNIEDQLTIKDEIQNLSFASKHIFSYKCPTCQENWRDIAKGARLGQSENGELFHIDCNEQSRHLYYKDVYPNLGKIYKTGSNILEFDQLKLSTNVTIPLQWECNHCHNLFNLSISKMFSRIKRDSVYCYECKASFKELFFETDSTIPLSYLTPNYIKEWSSENTVHPTQVDILSDIEVKWSCKNCHGSYTAKICEKDSRSCPYCNDREMLSGFNSLEKTHSYLEIFWDSSNTKSLSEIWYKSTELMNWICPCCSVVFQCSPIEMISRVNLDNRNFQTCPALCDWTDKVFNNIIFHDTPIFLKEWSSKNEISLHRASMYQEYKKYWWNCSKCNGEYRCSIPIRREVTNSCPYCNKEQILKGYNTLADQYPVLAKYWSSKNELEPGNITLDPLENKRYLWKCVSCHMDFKSMFREVLKAYGEIEIAGLSDICPYCTRELPNPQTESLNIVKPFLIEEWHKNISNSKPIEEFFPESEIKLWWKCRNCHGQFLARICDREENDDCCPYCSGRTVLAGFNDLETVHPELLNEWSSKNIKKMSEVLANSTMLALWECHSCHGIFQKQINKRINEGHVCPYCSNKKVLSGFNNLDITHPELIPVWHPKNKISIKKVTATSSKIVMWSCQKCKENYSESIRNRVQKNFECPYCSGKKILKGFNSFDVKYPHLMKEWDYLNNVLLLNPSEISESNTKSVWWICQNDSNHHYKMSIYKRIQCKKRSKEPCSICKGRRRKREHFLPFK